MWDNISKEHYTKVNSSDWKSSYRRDIAHHYMTYYPYDNEKFIREYYHDITNLGIEIPSDTEMGGPLSLNIDEKIITQDVITTAEEVHTINNQIALDSINTITEIGAGYGRTCWLLFKKYPNITKYIIVDIEPALTISKYHLKETLSSNDFSKIEHFTPEQFQDYHQDCDLIISISTLDELKEEIRKIYLNKIFAK